jgi:uncharacterized membrane protein YkgB
MAAGRDAEMKTYAVSAVLGAMGMIVGAWLAVATLLDGRHHSALVGALLAAFSAAVLMTSLLRLRH